MNHARSLRERFDETDILTGARLKAAKLNVNTFRSTPNWCALFEGHYEERQKLAYS